MSSREMNQERQCERHALAMSYVPWHDWEELLERNEALERGTVFESLDFPFFASGSGEKRGTRRSERECALLEVQRLGFMTDDLRLFLNTHPNCGEALRALKYYLHAEAEARKAYEKRYGALTLEGVSRERYDWIGGVWPWEAEE